MHPAPHTPHPTPYTLHSAPCTLHPTPYTPHPQPDRTGATGPWRSSSAPSENCVPSTMLSLQLISLISCLIDRIVGVSPCPTQARIRYALLPNKALGSARCGSRGQSFLRKGVSLAYVGSI
ncbi:hypothetical protein T484DRAFT_3647687 [Baffinella frigidus]|nr:hypothetical protein T484DRAFT_3647687 [Cryptophyta sp. CCMP2293]